MTLALHNRRHEWQNVAVMIDPPALLAYAPALNGAAACRCLVIHIYAIQESGSQYVAKIQSGDIAGSLNGCR